ncbi:hypothetical protein [Roseibium sp. RKSG952]|uniref:hypothetical protein n=1 Tax=Roseibium sp. RKSG952 TaxID=2529384 RepID=UPI0012BBF449|nr:hypothetical protein [Roseibium sp. RKSG952]MTH94991.1 hypothetical protein [Roseibium sp. RKSG952]
MKRPQLPFREKVSLHLSSAFAHNLENEQTPTTPRNMNLRTKVKDELQRSITTEGPKNARRAGMKIRSANNVDKKPLMCEKPHMSTHSHRPRSLAEIALNVRGDTPYNHAMKEFIDHLSVVCPPSTREEGTVAVPLGAFSEEPVRLERKPHNAHLAGMAEFLAHLADVQPPEWCFKNRFFLKEPFVVAPGRRSGEMIMAATPGAFKRRNLFCGAVLRDFVNSKTGR